MSSIDFWILTGVLGFFNLLFLIYYFKLRGYCQELLYFKEDYETLLFKLKKKMIDKRKLDEEKKFKKVVKLLSKKDSVTIEDVTYFKKKDLNDFGLDACFYYQVKHRKDGEVIYLGQEAI